MNNLKIRKEEGRWYWSLITSGGKMLCGSSGVLQEALKKISEVYNGAKVKRVVGTRSGGRWHIQVCRDAVVSDYILGDARQLAKC
jgi:hypothetical protein